VTRWIAINAERVVGIHGFTPRDTTWTTIILEGDVGTKKKKGIMGVMENVTGGGNGSSSSANAMGGSGSAGDGVSGSGIGGKFGGVVPGEKSKGLVSCEVAVPVLDVLQCLDADAFPRGVSAV
jgi:hypothetical protein